MTARPEAIQISVETRIRWCRDTLFRNLGGEAVLLGTTPAAYDGLDLVGTRIWELIGEQELLGDVVQLIVEEYDVNEVEALVDTIRLVTELVNHGLVEIVVPLA